MWVPLDKLRRRNNEKSSSAGAWGRARKTNEINSSQAMPVGEPPLHKIRYLLIFSLINALLNARVNAAQRLAGAGRVMRITVC